jgi:hypothetical protein
MLKKYASFVLAALRDSTYGKNYASSPRLLRPRWTAFLNILPDCLRRERDTAVEAVRLGYWRILAQAF